MGAFTFSSSALNQKYQNPEWRCCIHVPLVGSTHLECVCWNVDELGKAYGGGFDIAVEDIFSRGEVYQEPEWHRLTDWRRNGSQTEIQASGEVMLSFSPVDSGNAAATPGEIYEKLRKLVELEEFLDSCETSTDRDRDQSHAEDARDEFNATNSSQSSTEPSGIELSLPSRRVTKSARVSHQAAFRKNRVR
jgi:phosphatidylserine decarboxylase